MHTNRNTANGGTVSLSIRWSVMVTVQLVYRLSVCTDMVVGIGNKYSSPARWQHSSSIRFSYSIDSRTALRTAQQRYGNDSSPVTVTRIQLPVRTAGTPIWTGRFTLRSVTVYGYHAGTGRLDWWYRICVRIRKIRQQQNTANTANTIYSSYSIAYSINTANTATAANTAITAALQICRIAIKFIPHQISIQINKYIPYSKYQQYTAISNQIRHFSKFKINSFIHTAVWIYSNK